MQKERMIGYLSLFQMECLAHDPLYQFSCFFQTFSNVFYDVLCIFHCYSLMILLVAYLLFDEVVDALKAYSLRFFWLPICFD